MPRFAQRAHKIHGGHAGVQSGELHDLVIVEPRRLAHQQPVPLVRQTEDKLRVGVADHSHVQQAGGLVRDEKALPVGPHLRDGVGQHLHGFALEVGALLALLRRGAAQKVMGLLQYRDVLKATVWAVRTRRSLGHTVFLELEDQRPHQQCLCLGGAHPAQIYNDILIEQLPAVELIIGTEDLPVDAIGQRLQPGQQRALVVPLRIVGEALAVHHLRQCTHHIPERGEPARPGAPGGAEVPAAAPVCALHSGFQNGGHGGVHGPAGVEDLDEAVDVFQHMGVLWEGEGVEA